jgi:hypothetical protein
MTADRRLLTLLLLLTATPLSAAEPDPVKQKQKEIAGVAEFLRAVPKHFATLQAVDLERRRVTLLIEGEKLPKTWELTPEAEVKVAGWWGRLDQLAAGDRVWVWFHADRQKRPDAVMMLADEMSEQDVHGTEWKATAADGSVTLKPSKGAERVLKPADAKAGLPAGRVYFQSAGDKLRLIVGADEFEKRRAAQKAELAGRWTKEGLPGTVMFLHQYSGEMELMLDHEAMRWGRSLKPGDSVALAARPEIKAVVKRVRPWHERTQVLLVVAAWDQSDLQLGQRVGLKVTAPPAEVADALLPPDLDKPRSKEERVEWFLASVYCTCGVTRDTCTGHFYTLASCNPNGCGMPAMMRKKLAEMIDAGKTDRQIFEQLLKDQGPLLLKPHLLP